MNRTLACLLAILYFSAVALHAADFPAVIVDPSWRPINIARPSVDELYNQGTDYLNNGNYDKAIGVFSEAIRIDPTREEIFLNRGVGKKKKGDLDGAIADYTKAIELKPGDNLAYHNRALAYEAKGEYEKALLDTGSEMQIAPQNPKGFNETAWIYATCPKAEFRDGAKAIKLATKACALSQWKNGNHIDTLAAAEAEAGKFDAALRHEQMAIVTQKPANDDAEELQNHLVLFQQHKPFRDFNIKSINGIIGAVGTGDLPKVQVLLNEYPGLASCRDIDGYTPLQAAANNGRKDITELLLANGADVNIGSTKGSTPLHYAAVFSSDIAVLLLAKGADVNARENDGTTPLHYAAMIGNQGTAEVLLVNKADVNASNNKGVTPLFEAAASGRTNLVKLLLVFKADANAKTKDGRTPLQTAIANGHAGVADLLRQYGGHE